MRVYVHEYMRLFICLFCVRVCVLCLHMHVHGLTHLYLYMHTHLQTWNTWIVPNKALSLYLTLSYAYILTSTLIHA